MTTTDLLRIVNILADKIKRDYAADVALVCVYGSFIRNAIYEKSDVDFYFIPRTQRGYEMAKTFIIDDIGFDLWPISWERAETIAHYIQGFVSLIADAQVVWYSSEEDLTRFTDLQAIAKSPNKTVDFDKRAATLLDRCYSLYFSLLESKDDFSLLKQKAVNLVTVLIEAVAVANHTYTHRGWSHSLTEVLAMEKVPGGFRESIEAVLFASETATLIDKAFESIAAVKSLSEISPTYTVNYKESFTGFFEEAKSTYNKLYHACDVGDTVTAMMAGVSIQNEIMSVMGLQPYRQCGFVDIVSSFKKDDLPFYKSVVANHERQFEVFLIENGVSICRYDTLDEFGKHLMLHICNDG